MIIAAIPVGFFAGLFGIGGGLVMVPFLFYVFESLKIDANYTINSQRADGFNRNIFIVNNCECNDSNN